MGSEPAIRTETELDERLSRPGPEVVAALARLEGDIVVLGAGGKMGPSLARMARRALDESGSRREVFAVSRWSDPSARAQVEAAGVKTVAADLLERKALDALPEAGAVVFMTGRKFGSHARAADTWAVNALVPGLAATRYPGVPTVVFSTGNVYPLVPAGGGGATEETPPAPAGEYAWSALARERIFEHASRAAGTPVAILRLNYAVELRYGVLHDVARNVAEGRPVGLAMGFVNVIWQGDANAIALRALAAATVPPRVLNVAGEETVSVRALALRFGERLGRAPVFQGTEAPDALLSDASRARALFGPPSMELDTLVEAVSGWVRGGGRSLGKPTRFEVRDGAY